MSDWYGVRDAACPLSTRKGEGGGRGSGSAASARFGRRAAGTAGADAARAPRGQAFAMSSEGPVSAYVNPGGVSRFTHLRAAGTCGSGPPGAAVSRRRVRLPRGTFHGA